MKRTNILAIAVLLLISLFISSCENEKLEPSPTEQSISPSEFIARSQNAVETLNKFYKQSSSQLESRSGESFEELWGQPNYDKLVTLKTSANKDLTIAPLQNLNTDVTHNLLVGWQQSDSIALRIVHDDRILTDLTFDNTALTRSVSNLFDVFNSGDDISTTALLSGNQCFEIVGVGQYSLILQAVEECDDDNTGGGGVPDPNADTAPSTGGSGNNDTNPNIPDNSNETTDPDCYGGCGGCFDQPDDPACAGCIITADLNCDGVLDNYELCLPSGNIWNCCLINNSCTAEHTALQTLQNNGINQSDLQWLFDNSSYISSVMTFAQEKNFDAESMAAIEVLVQLGQNNLLFSDYSQSDIELADQIHINAEACCPFLDPTFPMILDPTLPLQHHIRHQQEYAVLKQKWMDENSGQSPNLYYKTTLFLRAEWNIMIGVTHTALDICGLVPFLGECFDLANGVLYTIEGDGMNATLSYASAIPFIGNVAAGTKFYRAYDLGNKTFNLTLEVGQILYKFGDRNKLKNLIKPGANEQAHHMITWARNDHDIIQLAAQKAWHPSHPKNGINLDLSIHNGWDAAHATYSNNLKDFLDSKIDDYTDPNDAKNFLENLQASIKSQFESGKLLDEITFP